MDFLYFILGSICIFYGSTFLIDNSTLIARSLKISPFIIGLTVIAFGTSLPELVVSVMSSIRNEGSIVIGNVVGSNIANILLVLSVILIMKPITINFDSAKQGALYLFISTFILVLLIWYEILSFFPGLLLLSLFFFYMVSQFSRKNNINKEINSNDKFKPAYIVYIAIGIFLLGYGSHLFINSSISIAEIFNIPKIAISVSLVAFGTSVPELVTSIVAIKKGEPNFVIGNILGSNIINIFLVLGSSLLINDILIPLKSIFYPFLFMILSTLLFLLLIFFQNKMSRIHGLFFIALYTMFIYLMI